MRTLFFAVLMTPVLALAEAPQPRTLELLGLIDTPVTRADLDRAAGGDAAAVLQRIALDPDAFTLQRQRAVEALRAYPSDETRNVMMALAKDRQPVLRKRAITGLAHYPHTGDVAAALEAALSDEEVAVRKTAIRILAERPSSHPALQRHLKDETDVHARRLLNQVLESHAQ